VSLNQFAAKSEALLPPIGKIRRPRPDGVEALEPKAGIDLPPYLHKSVVLFPDIAVRPATAVHGELAEAVKRRD